MSSRNAPGKPGGNPRRLALGHILAHDLDKHQGNAEAAILKKTYIYVHHVENDTKGRSKNNTFLIKL